MSGIDVLRDTVSTIQAESGGSAADVCKIDGLLVLRQYEVDERRALLERFDFRSHDVDHTRRVVDEFDDEIAVLSRERYSLTYNRKKIRAAINEGRVVFEAHDAERLFREAGVLVWMPNERYLDQQASGCSMPVCGSSTWAAAPPSKPASGHPAEQCLLSRHKLGEVSADVRRS